MPHDLVVRYFICARELLGRIESGIVEEYTEEFVTDDRGVLTFRIRLEHGNQLHVAECVRVTETGLSPVDYRYHFQDRHAQLIFRYDSARHHPGLDCFPHHKHVADGVVGCVKPTLVELLNEAGAVSTAAERSDPRHGGSVSGRPEARAREALSGFTGSLSDDISADREDRV